MELEIPARLEFVALARLLVSSFAASSAVLPDDRIDDLKIAVSEACTASSTPSSRPANWLSFERTRSKAPFPSTS